jgi:predicted dienelactone hydrolase
MRLLSIVITLALVAASCGSDGTDAAAESTTTTSTAADSTTTAPTTAAPTTTTTTTTTEPPLTPLTILDRGDHPVGVATVEIGSDTDRPLTVDIWFPLDADATGDQQQYTLLPGVYYESPLALAANPDSIEGSDPFPLVIYSHGSGGLRYIHSDYTEFIASHGYIVAAPDHTGNTSVDLLLSSSDDPATVAVNRVQDVGRVIDALVDAENEVTGAYATRVDAESIAVTGHSFGGFTSFAMVSGYENDLGGSPADKRVDAIITLAPFTTPILDDATLGMVDVPSMMIVGTDDKTTPADPHVTRPWDLITSTSSYRVELEAAEHQTFTDVCDYQDFLPTLEAVPEPITTTIDSFAEAGCQPGDMPTDRAQELTNTFAIRFLEQVFRGDEGLDATRTEMPDDVVFFSR